MSSEILASIIGALSAIVSSLLTNYFRNKHELKLKQLESINNFRNKILTEYINCCFDGEFFSDNIKFYRAHNKLLITADKDEIEYLDKIKDTIIKGNSNETINSVLNEYISFLKTRNNKRK